ncbi:MAG: hypothetical protein HYZ83_05370 [Candidatus Omnitrophica bacterium]|nr:hypothetical protein [Candidatus Omnitrophota bacterium]
MMQYKSKGILVLFFVFLFSSLIAQATADNFSGTIPTGLLELKDYKYPVFLYVPPTYEPDKDYPLLIALSGEGETPEKNMEYWSGMAKRNNVIVLSPVSMWAKDMPGNLDKWLIGLKDDVMDRYRISPQRVYLVGRNKSAHYASYLGVNYPDEFSAVAMVGGSVTGIFDKLMKFQTSPERQRPLLMMVPEEQSQVLKETEQRAYEFEKKGYPVYLKKIAKGEDVSSNDFKKQILDWFEEKSKDWQDNIKKSKKTFKAKWNKGVKDFFAL